MRDGAGQVAGVEGRHSRVGDRGGWNVGVVLAKHRKWYHG